MLAIYEDRQVFVVVPLSLDRRKWSYRRLTSAQCRYTKDSELVRNMNDLAVCLQKEKILCAIVMFRNLTKSEDFTFKLTPYTDVRGVTTT